MKKVEILIVGTDSLANTDIATEIYDRLSRLGYACSLEDGRTLLSCVQLQPLGSIKMRTEEKKVKQPGIGD